METINGKFALMQTQKMYEIKDESGKKIGQFYLTHDEKGNILVRGSDVTASYLLMNADRVIETNTFVIESTEYPDGYLDVTTYEEMFIEEGTNVPMPRAFYEPSEDDFIEYINYNTAEVEIFGVSANVDADTLGYMGIFDECYENWKEIVKDGEIELDTEFFTFLDEDCIEWLNDNHQCYRDVVLASNGFHETYDENISIASDLIEFVQSLILKTAEGVHVWDSEIWNGLLTILNGHSDF